jgi:uncharacterized protein YqjF (DUF2071 family)
MNFLKRIPIHYRGELHDVRLINFSVAMEEVKNKVPANIKIRDFNGRAMISMVDVKLKRMHPVFMPSFLNFNYRHVAFRLLVDDSAYNDGVSKGIFFYKAFTDKPLIIAGGRLLTDYNLGAASIEENNNAVVIAQGKEHVKYCIDDTCNTPDNRLKETIGALDRAYAVLGDTLRVTQIQREKWPIQAVNCTGFENTFFKTAKLEGAFRVFETIYYDWFPPKTVTV